MGSLGTATLMGATALGILSGGGTNNARSQTILPLAGTGPVAPGLPAAADDDGYGRTSNPGMEAERDAAYGAARSRQGRAPEVFTSPLGAAGLAEVNRKSLLGG